MVQVEPPQPRWGVVGNVVTERLYGENAQVRRGAKLFPGGTKVYYHSAFWGMGAESLTVVGLSRRPRRWIRASISSDLVENWRAKLIHSPSALQELDGDDIGGDEQRAYAMAASLNEISAFHGLRLVARTPQDCRDAAAVAGEAMASGSLVAEPAHDGGLVLYAGTRAVAGVIFQAADPAPGASQKAPFDCRCLWVTAASAADFLSGLQRRFPHHDLAEVRALIAAAHA